MPYSCTYVRIVASRSRTTRAICRVSVKTGSRIGFRVSPGAILLIGAPFVARAILRMIRSREEARPCAQRSPVPRPDRGRRRPGRRRSPARARCSCAPEAVGLCGSDFHYFHGTWARSTTRRALPADPGARGRGDGRRARRGPARRTLAAGVRIAIWRSRRAASAIRAASAAATRARASADGHPRRRGAAGAAPPPASQVFPVGDEDPALGALIEPSRSPCAPGRGVASRQERRRRSSAPARSGRRWPWRRSIAGHRCCSSTGSRAGWTAAPPGAPRWSAPPRGRTSPPLFGSGRTETGRRSSSRRPGCPSWCDSRRARGVGRARGRRRAVERARRRFTSASCRSRRSTCSG